MPKTQNRLSDSFVRAAYHKHVRLFYEPSPTPQRLGVIDLPWLDVMNNAKFNFRELIRCGWLVHGDPNKSHLWQTARIIDPGLSFSFALHRLRTISSELVGDRMTPAVLERSHQYKFLHGPIFHHSVPKQVHRIDIITIRGYDNWVLHCRGFRNTQWVQDAVFGESSNYQAAGSSS